MGQSNQLQVRKLLVFFYYFLQNKALEEKWGFVTNFYDYFCPR